MRRNATATSRNNLDIKIILVFAPNQVAEMYISGNPSPLLGPEPRSHTLTDEQHLSTEETEFHLPEDHSPLPELIHLESHHEKPSGDRFIAAMDSPAYAKLRATFRSFAFPMTVAGLTCYFVYVILSIYAPGFMGTPAIGALNWGSLIGLLQFVIVWAWTAIYVRFANSRLDTAAADLKTQLETGAQA